MTADSHQRVGIIAAGKGRWLAVLVRARDSHPSGSGELGGSRFLALRSHLHNYLKNKVRDAQTLVQVGNPRSNSWS
jgi:hypothetical protein